MLGLIVLYIVEGDGVPGALIAILLPQTLVETASVIRYTWEER
jgi:hypothetical protein